MMCFAWSFRISLDLWTISLPKYTGKLEKQERIQWRHRGPELQVSFPCFLSNCGKCWIQALNLPSVMSPLLAREWDRRLLGTFRRQGAFTGTLANVVCPKSLEKVRVVLVNMAMQVRQTSPNFASLRMKARRCFCCPLDWHETSCFSVISAVRCYCTQSCLWAAKM